MNSAIRTVHAIYFYTVVAVSVFAISIASFVLVRRILIDTAVPQLRIDNSYITYIPACEDKSSYDEVQCEQQKKMNEERNQEEYRRLQAEQYLYSILTMLIAATVAGIHISLFRPKSA